MLSSDQKLVERCLRGDDAAWEVVVNSYGRRIYSLGYRYTRRKDESEDLTQEIFVRVYRNLSSYRAEAGSFQNWILKVARNLIIDHCRKTRRYPQAEGSEKLDLVNIADDNGQNPQRAFEQVEASRFLHDGLSSLSPELREAIVLRDLECMAYRDIADLLEVPEGTVKSRINRARLELAGLLMKRRNRLGSKVQE